MADWMVFQPALVGKAAPRLEQNVWAPRVEAEAARTEPAAFPPARRQCARPSWKFAIGAAGAGATPWGTDEGAGAGGRTYTGSDCCNTALAFAVPSAPHEGQLTVNGI